MSTSVALEHYRAFARYNERFNRHLYHIVGTLPEDDRKRDLGAFFGSIEATLNHLLLADRIWLGRFQRSGHDFPALEEATLVYEVQSLAQGITDDFATLTRERIDTDQVILAWTFDLTEEILVAPFRYGNTKGVAREHPLWIAVSQLFNHQTHHRGQITTLLKQLGHDPGVTDFLAFALR